jgi:hypothetical protein
MEEQGVTTTRLAGRPILQQVRDSFRFHSGSRREEQEEGTKKKEQKKKNDFFRYQR